MMYFQFNYRESISRKRRIVVFANQLVSIEESTDDTCVVRTTDRAYIVDGKFDQVLVDLKRGATQ